MSQEAVAKTFPNRIGQRTFILLTAAAIIISRILFIGATPGWENFPDIRIYQAVGTAVLSGVNPYDYSDKPELRRQLRKDMQTSPDDFVTVSQDRWNAYLSANPPASTALYTVFEKIANGSRRNWRLLFILGDLAILLGLTALIRTVHGALTDIRHQAAVFCLTVIYPLISLAVAFVSEDKQFQTALMLFSAALLLPPPRQQASRNFGIGIVLSISVMFKLFGAFLFPLWLSRVLRDKPAFAVWTILGGCVPIALALIVLRGDFITAILYRGLENSYGSPSNGSPWRFLPWLDQTQLFVVKLAVVGTCCAGLAALLAKGKIDPLNFSAGLGVVMVCLWLENGSMDRMNIVLMFAMASILTLSTRRFLAFSVFATILSIVAFALKISSGGVSEIVDAGVVVLLLAAYAAVLLSIWPFEDSKNAFIGKSVQYE